MIFSNNKANLTVKTLCFVLIGSFLLSNAFMIRVFAQNTRIDTSSKSSFLGKYTTDLTELAEAGRLNKTGGFEREVNQLVNSLTDAGMKQPVVLDEIGESQTLIVESLAQRVAAGEVPAKLKGRRVLQLELNSLFSNTKSAEENSQAVAEVIAELAASKDEFILFVDELSNFVGSKKINNALTEALLQGKVKIIGGSSIAAYQDRIENEAELDAIFQTITVGGLNSAEEEADVTTSSENPLGYRGDTVSPDLREMMANDPTGNKRVDLIIQSKDADSEVLREIMAQNRARRTNRIGQSETLTVNMPLSAVDVLANSGTINYMSPDRELVSTGHIENVTGAATIRSQPAFNGRAAYTLDGAGIGIAILDSGVSGITLTHKSFTEGTTASRVVYSQNFTTSPTVGDAYGHGTHVAAIAAGSSSRDGGAYQGIAPKANIYNLKVLEDNGTGKTANLLNALDWLLINAERNNIRIVNMSLGGLAIDSYTNDPLCVKVRALAAKGILVVAAAGNEGKKATTGQKLYGHIHSPANDPTVLTVGAVNTFGTDSRSDDSVATYSSHGPTRSYYTRNGVKIHDNIIKPDILAPGNKIISAKADFTSMLTAMYPSLSTPTLNGVDQSNLMMYLSGTSMAAPAVSGAAALLLQVNPKLTPSMIKMILQYTAQPINGANMFEQGAGQMNIEGAVRLAKTYRSDLDFSLSATSGMSLLASGTTFPTASSTLNGANCNWAQGILTDHGYIKGQTLASIFHNVYRKDSWFEKGITHNTSGNFIFNTNFSSNGLVFTAKAVKNNGSAMGGGSVINAFGLLVTNGVLVSDGVLASDGVLVSDGVLASDGVLISDGVLVSDSVLVSDGVTTADTVSKGFWTGDDTAAMQ